MISKNKLKEVEDRANAATPGPWYTRNKLGGVFSNPGTTDGVFIAADDFNPIEANEIFAAHSRQDVPNLIAEIRRLREALEIIAGHKDDYGYGTLVTSPPARVAKLALGIEK